MPKNHDLLIAASTIWVVITAVLVMFMQAGFAFLEAGLTRMKNAGHIAGKNVLIFGALLDRLLGGRLRPRVRRRQRVHRHRGLLPVGRRADRRSGRSRSTGSPRSRARPATCSRSSSPASRSRSSGARWPSARSSGSTSSSASGSRSRTRSSRTGSGARTAGCSSTACRTSPARRSCTTRARSPALAGALILGPRIGKFGTDGRANPIPGHNIPYAVLGTLILWFGWFGFNPGSTLSVDFGGFGYFAYVALTTNIAAAAGAVTGMCVAWVKLGKPDISMMLNGALGALVAITAASGLRRAVGGDRDRRRLRLHRRLRRHLRRADRHRRPDRRGRRARHVRRLGHARDCGLFAVPLLAKNLATGHGRPRLHRLLPPARRAGARPRRRRRVHVRDVVRRALRAAQDLGHPRRAGRRDAGPRRRTSTACGATPSSTSRSRAATAPSRTAISAPARDASTDRRSHDAGGQESVAAIRRRPQEGGGSSTPA